MVNQTPRIVSPTLVTTHEEAQNYAPNLFHNLIHLHIISSTAKTTQKPCPAPPQQPPFFSLLTPPTKLTSITQKTFFFTLQNPPFHQPDPSQKSKFLPPPPTNPLQLVIIRLKTRPKKSSFLMGVLIMVIWLQICFWVLPFFGFH